MQSSEPQNLPPPGMDSDPATLSGSQADSTQFNGAQGQDMQYNNYEQWNNYNWDGYYNQGQMPQYNQGDLTQQQVVQYPNPMGQQPVQMPPNPMAFPQVGYGMLSDLCNFPFSHLGMPYGGYPMQPPALRMTSYSFSLFCLFSKRLVLLAAQFGLEIYQPRRRTTT
jgi:hypothetical protein